MLSRLTFVVLISLLGTSCIAQISQGGSPLEWLSDKSAYKGASHLLSSPDQQDVLAIAGAKSQGGQSFHWGIPRAVQLDLIKDGTSTIKNGVQLIKLSIKSPGASMISVQFSEFDLIPGAALYLYDAKRTRYVGSLTEASELPTGTMSTAVLPGEEVVLEYQVPVGSKGLSKLVVESIVHGVRDVFNFGTQLGTKDYYPGFGSQPCHNNVVCSAANGWQDQISAVALFLNAGGWGCNGVMVNNTAQDGRPLFHIANHCYVTDVNTWVFYWNYESPTCIGDTGQTQQTSVGAALLASDYYDDFALLELFSAPPSSYNVFYAGWDATGAQPLNQTVIHHPLYDVKKITFDNDPASSYTDAIGINMWGCTWESGIVEFVSSGSPLFDQNQRMIGHMTEGNNECATVSSEITGCAKFSESWNGTAASTRLHDHLDPLNSSTLVLNGFYPSSAQSTITVPVKVYLQGPYDASDGRMKDDLRMAAYIPSTEPYTALSYVFVGEGGNELVNASVLSQTGNNAVVDWVVVELRDKNDITNILSSRAALLKRNGRIVDVDGNELTFLMPPDNYYIAIVHRNHLGVVTAGTHSLGTNSPLTDLSTGTVSVYGGNANAMLLNNGVYMMFSGDTNGDQVLKYTGAANDRDVILLAIGGSVPTNIVGGYSRSDVNMDGLTKYTGAANDRDAILLNIGGSIPTDTRSAQLP